MTEPLLETLERMRRVGHAMRSWYLDNAEPGPGSDAPQAAGSSRDLDRIEDISADALEALLVPNYLERLPRTDGWGGEFEFRLIPRLGADHRMAVRSAGRDGKLSGPVYERGDFSPDDPSADVIWIDGYFLRRPRGILAPLPQAQ